jgi:hypothetical protein
MRRRRFHSWLHAFHTQQQRTAVAPRVAALSEALRLIEHLPEETRPPPAATRTARSAIDGFLDTLRSSFVPTEERLDPPDRPVAAPLRAAGLPVPDGAAEEADGPGDETRQERRHLLRALVEDDGWTWADVTQAEHVSALCALGQGTPRLNEF